MATRDATLLGTFQKHIEDMRSLIHCQICLKPFYEPFSLSCGHTYCYSCLASWLGGSQDRQRSKNCPDCRTIITTEPCPNYTLRDLVHMFCNRAELLPEDETVQEHEIAKAEEAQRLTIEKSGRGLFNGVFSRRLPVGPLGRPRFIRDDEDGGIMRCPFCAHEVVAGLCTNEGCGFGFEDHSAFSDGDENSEGDIHLHDPWGQADDSDGSDLPVTRGHPLFNLNDPLLDSEHEDEDDSEMDDFIERDEDQDLPNEDDEESVYDRPRHSRRRIQDSETDDVSDTDGSLATSEVPYNYNHYSGDHIDDDDSDGYENAPMHHQSPPPRAYPINYDSETSHEAVNHYPQAESSDVEEGTNYDSDDSSIREISPPPLGFRGRTTRRVIDSDDEEEEEEEEEAEDGEDEDADSEAAHVAQFSDVDLTLSAEEPCSSGPDSGVDSDGGSCQGSDEDSDDTATPHPPQSSTSRNLRLQQQRRNRSRRASSSAEPAPYSGFDRGGVHTRRRGAGGPPIGGRRLTPVVDLSTSGPRRPQGMRVY